MRTHEAPPTGLSAPSLIARGAISVGVQWTPPTTPNGLITGWLYYTRVTSIYLSANNTCPLEADLTTIV